MRKISNIFILLMLVCGCVLYCARLSSNEKEYAIADSSYDTSVSKEIETLLLDHNSLEKIIQSNHTSNTDIMETSIYGDGDSSAQNKKYEDFFELYQVAITNHMNAKNAEMICSTGKINAQGNIGSFSLNLTGAPTSLIQRDSSGHYYMDMKIPRMNLEGLVDLSIENFYYCNGSQFYTKQFNRGNRRPNNKTFSKQSFIDTYGILPTEMALDVSAETVDLHSFTYDERTERYIANFSFKQVNGGSLGLKKYANFIDAMATHREVKNNGINM